MLSFWGTNVATGMFPAFIWNIFQDVVNLITICLILLAKTKLKDLE
ncbi:hypothetical protein AAULH_12096 [Lactobacillus helveticus MTCC 5463]|nr:hypothetical protein AAULH_12096 [Lactobacillus helveticus MTCC 5463]